jgi:hypothetical protein
MGELSELPPDLPVPVFPPDKNAEQVVACLSST